MFTVRRSLCVSTRANLHATTSRVRTTRRPGTSVSAKRDAAFFQLEIYLILHQILQLVESTRNFFDFDRDQREDSA
jgi:hypothetical protein